MLHKHAFNRSSWTKTVRFENDIKSIPLSDIAAPRRSYAFDSVG